ncbi:3-carboxy-cis,cis-muconate cycloisomerase [Roseivivax jejudonensis]|uniref:3-carboxy-cis,cis-muconate cycloisomerase n=1 Tax=Roseivivax jejudonensis TaxID=1529041 RepID=A0A1X6ZFJ9_9RHOB|nr:lyase family protein [Roseivivax jejudonensis]SLN50242.1 3-carboxy-cis,cis-muconate cycloisomerase [Roseivivax jejudonensis]
MTGTIASPLYAHLFPAGDVGRLFTDSAEVRAMMIVEGALAKVQGAAGTIPELSAAAIHRASLELQIDPGGLARATGENGVPVPSLVAAFRDAMQAPEHAQYLHWGATSQDIVDTGLMLRLRQVLGHYGDALDRLLDALAGLAETHARTPMAARTYGQHATPTAFGAVAASWGWPLLTLRAEIPALIDALPVSLSGAAGTAEALGPEAPVLRAALAEALGLADPGHSWHTDRTPVTAVAAWIARAASALAKIGEDLILAAQSDVREVRLAQAGGSSTMPQKQNPVAPSALVALAAQAHGLNATLQGAGAHRQQRDGAAWFTEWLTLPPLAQALAAALARAEEAVGGLEIDAAAMERVLSESQGLLAAEALSFALTARMSRPEAQAEVKALVREVVATGGHLRDAALAKWPEIDSGLFDPHVELGQAPAEAHAFAAAARQATAR